MKVGINFVDNILIISLPHTYGVITISEIMNLVETNELKNTQNTVIDCSELEILDSFGGEVFLLKKNYNMKYFLFCGVKSVVEPILNVFSQDFFQEDIVNFPTQKDAIDFIKKNNTIT